MSCAGLVNLSSSVGPTWTCAPNWMEIQNRWIKEDKEILSTNCRLTCSKISTLPRDQFSQPDLEKEKEREKEKKIQILERECQTSL